MFQGGAQIKKCTGEENDREELFENKKIDSTIRSSKHGGGDKTPSLERVGGRACFDEVEKAQADKSNRLVWHNGTS